MIAESSAANTVGIVTTLVSTRPLPIVVATAVPAERSEQIPERRPDDGLARGQHLGRDDRGDGVGAVVKAVDVLEDERRQQDEQEECHARATAQEYFSTI